MTTVHDIPADLMISSLSAKLEVDGIVNQPEWSTFVKTGIHRERIPVQENWWAIRSAAVLRKVAIKGPIGVNRLATNLVAQETGALNQTQPHPALEKLSARYSNSSRARDSWNLGNLPVEM